MIKFSVVIFHSVLFLNHLANVQNENLFSKIDVDVNLLIYVTAQVNARSSCLPILYDQFLVGIETAFKK